MRRIGYHVEARLDVLEIVEYYEQRSGVALADRFVTELLHFIEAIAKRPESFPEHVTGIRRVNLDRFPHHVLFRILDERAIKILAVKHNNGHPSHGLQRR